MLHPLPLNNVFVIVPYYNENTVIRKVISDLINYSREVILVDDGSAESPLSLLKDLPPFHYIRHKVNLGQGAALQTGIDYALQNGAEYIVTFDGDGQHVAADIDAMLLPLQNGDADITLASRFLKKGLHNASILKQGMLNAGRIVNYLFTGLYLSDAHNGLRAMNRKAAELLHIKENRMAHATEILFLIRHHQLRIKEIPAQVIYTDYSKKKGQSVFNSIRIFFDLVLHKLFE